MILTGSKITPLDIMLVWIYVIGSYRARIHHESFIPFENYKLFGRRFDALHQRFLVSLVLHQSIAHERHIYFNRFTCLVTPEWF